MSEENSLIYCSQCGSANPATFKFCSNCGSKLEQPKVNSSEILQSQEPIPEQADEPVYEKAEAEVISEGKVPLTEDELHINYGAEEENSNLSGSYSSGSYSTPDTQYYSASNGYSTSGSKNSNGNGGFAIASMICGILSIVCCCLTWFSLVLGIAAVVLGIIAINGKYDGKGMAIAGIITGGIGIFIWLIVILSMGSGIFTTFIEELSDL